MTKKKTKNNLRLIVTLGEDDPRVFDLAVKPSQLEAARRAVDAGVAAFSVAVGDALKQTRTTTRRAAGKRKRADHPTNKKTSALFA